MEERLELLLLWGGWGLSSRWEGEGVESVSR